MAEQPTNDYPRIYTAGAMRWQGHGDSSWRRSVDEWLTDVTFYHPEDTYFDHGGDYVQGAVSEDIQAINAADGLVAFFSETPQMGTAVETLHALHTDTPTLVLFDKSLIDLPNTQEYPGSDILDGRDGEYPTEVDGVTLRGSADDHWFLINYINGDDDHAAGRSFPNWISAWDGMQRGSIVGVADTADIQDAVKGWIDDEFDVELQ